MNTDIKEMEITDYNIFQNIKAAMYRLWKLKFVVVLSTLIGILGSLMYITISGNDFSYYSTATIYSAVYGSYSETVSGVTLMNTYASILGTSRVCNRAAAEINSPDVSPAYLQGLVNSGKVYISGASTESKKFGYRLVLGTRLDTPEHVVEITNAMANAFTNEINELLGDDIIQVFDEATTSFMTAATSNMLIVAICAVLGFVLSAMIIFAIEFFSHKVQIVSQCSGDKDLILGILPYNK